MGKHLSRRFVCEYGDCENTATVLWEYRCGNERIWMSSRCPKHPANNQYMTPGQPLDPNPDRDKLALEA